MEGRRGGNGGRRTKGVECLKSYILGGNGSSASLEVNKRSFGEVIRNIGGHIRRRKFNWSLEYSKKCKDGGQGSFNREHC